MTVENGAQLKLHPFQRTMLGDYFGGCRETLVLMPKKGGKSTLLAAVALHRLLGEAGVNVAIVASSRDQAMVLFEQARGFVQRTPWLQDCVRVLRGYREIRRRVPGSESEVEFDGMIKVYAADADTVDGWLGNLALVDELHRHKSGDLYGVLRDGLGPRDGQMITISTAGDTEDSPLGLLRANAYALEGLRRDGAYRTVRSEGFALHEWALEPTDDLNDLALVKQANPAPWQTTTKLRQRLESPSTTPNQWARFACGVWGMGGDSFFDGTRWDSLPHEDGWQPDRGRRITLGFDGARRRDGTALVGCDVEMGRLFVLGYWQKPADADDDWEVPESEVDEIVDHAFETWDVWRLYGDPPWWESALDRWAGRHGAKRVIRWWTNRIKTTAVALRGFRNDMRPDEMSHDGDPKLAEHIRNAVSQTTRMVEDNEPLAVIRKDSKDSLRKIDLAMAALLAWEARCDAIRTGATSQDRSVIFL